MKDGGLIFAGCSFTWGEGLELYSDLPSIRIGYFKQNGYFYPECWDKQEKSHLKFIEKNRFSGIIESHYNTFSLVHPNNGGSLKTMQTHITKSLMEYPPSDINGIVVQMTELLRSVKFHTNCSDECCYDDIWKLINSYLIVERYTKNEDKHLPDKYDYYNHNIFKKYFEKEDPIEILNKYALDNLINFLKYLYELHLDTKIPILFLGSWVGDLNYYDLLKNKELDLYNFYNSNLVKIKHKNLEFNNISNLISSDNSLVIQGDLPWSNNWHPSLKCHKILANSIIDEIDNRNIFK